jgi:OOP family OmpA-OmpF porin
VAAADEVFGSVSAAITEDPAVSSPPWVAPLTQALPVLRYVARPGLSVDGSVLTLAGRIASESRRLEIIAAFSPLGLEIADGLGIATPPSAAEAAALEASLAEALHDEVVLFETGSADVSADGTTVLDGIAELLIAAPGARVEVGGHTDSEGPADANLALSLERAEAVVSYLVSAGVDPIQLTAAGYGEDQPIADNATAEGRAANRRIEFVVEGSE